MHILQDEDAEGGLDDVARAQKIEGDHRERDRRAVSGCGGPSGPAIGTNGGTEEQRERGIGLINDRLQLTSASGTNPLRNSETYILIQR